MTRSRRRAAPEPLVKLGARALGDHPEPATRERLVLALGALRVLGGVELSGALGDDGLTPGRARALVEAHLDPGADAPSVALRWLVEGGATADLEAAAPEALAALARALDASTPAASSAEAVDRMGALRAALLDDAAHAGPTWRSSRARRRSGAHYTPYALAREVAARALGPIVARADALEALRVVDPSMGAGAFLAAALAELEAAAAARGLEVPRAAWLCCLHGVDADPIAVALARTLLAHLVGAPDEATRSLETQLVVGDAAVGPVFGARHAPPHAEASEELRRAAAAPPLDWAAAFPEVAARGGFDVVVGNPPWIAWAGRAAQPLAPALRAYHAAEHASFAGYRTLHGVFTERATRLVRAGGRLGLVLPTSMADLDGYARARAAHDARAEPDEGLVDLGADAFDGVFQPAMVLASTRLDEARSPPASTWSLARGELDRALLAWLEAIEGAPTLPRETFGERGVQTTGADRAAFSAAPGRVGYVPIRAGVDVRAFAARAPTRFVDPAALGPRLRSPESWARVDVLVRQTARFPIAARSDGIAFRNSVLAGFGTEVLGADGLVALLNATPTRFLHFHRFRDARQGMPQVKIAHLRRTPSLGLEGAARARLERLGAALGGRNAGIDASEQAALDDVVLEAWSVPPAVIASMRAWAASIG